jgi:hypothetical protein
MERDAFVLSIGCSDSVKSEIGLSGTSESAPRRSIGQEHLCRRSCEAVSTHETLNHTPLTHDNDIPPC